MNDNICINSKKKSIWARILGFLVIWLVSIWIYGAIPGFSLPTLLQALWTSGFAQSFVNQGWPSIYATYIGYPHPAPLSFGLAGAFLQSTFIALNLSAPVAYSAMVSTYLGLALWGALQFSRALGLGFLLALLMGLTWLSLPIVWAHAPYCMLSLGIALLPFYLWSAQLICQPVSAVSTKNQPHSYFNFKAFTRRFFIFKPINTSNYLAVNTSVHQLEEMANPLLATVYQQSIVLRSIAFWAVCLIAIFMDGYTYMMFLCGIGLLFGFSLLQNRFAFRQLLIKRLPILLIGIVVSYQLYINYEDQTTFTLTSLDFFRAWGVDLTMLFIPTKNAYWLWDILGMNIPRLDANYFGDNSVWLTTFSGFLIVLGLIGFFINKTQKYTYVLLAIAVWGFYMALGPSLKFNILRDSKNEQKTMLQVYAPFNTGNAFISQHVPGFKNMRATYRWMALSLLGFWGLLGLLIVRLENAGYSKPAILLLLFVIINYLPDPNVPTGVGYCLPKHCLDSFNQIQVKLVDSLKEAIKPNSLVVFFPLSMNINKKQNLQDNSNNAFLANYLAAGAGFKTYNIGGDKNVEMAQKYWPNTINYLFLTAYHPQSDEAIAAIKKVLLAKVADQVILFFLDLQYSGFNAPSPQIIQLLKQQSVHILDALSKDTKFNVITKFYFATISLNPASNLDLQ